MTTPRPVEQTYTVEVSGKRFDVTVIGAAPAYAAAPAAANGTGAGTGGRAAPSARAVAEAVATRSPHRCRARSSGLRCRPAPPSRRAHLVAVIEAMKMENEITAHKAGTIAELPIAAGASVSAGDTLAVITPAAE